PGDDNEGLAIPLRMGTEHPRGFDSRLEDACRAGEHDLVLKVKCVFRAGLPPGFVERLLVRCCHLGFPHP
ncbi:unnamed protein product, partial [Sphacelaria rigidula]